MGIRIQVPKKFSLMGRDWTVEFPEKLESGGVNCLGTCEPRQREIKILRDQDPQMALEVFAHEFTHAVVSPLELPNALEERVCRMMEFGMLEFVRAVVCVKGGK